MLTRKQIAEKRSRQIFQVASRVLCEMGYDRASIRDLAEATGLTKAGLYYYFKSKEELLFIILDGYMDDLLAGVSRISGEIADPEARLRAFIHFQVNHYCQDVHRSKLIIHDENCLTGQWYQQVKDKQRNYLEFWKNALGEYAEAAGKSIPFPSANVMLITGMCNWIYQWYDPYGPLPPDALADLIFERFTIGLKNARAGA
jgi:AcrR family transcriptional regulator